MIKNNFKRELRPYKIILQAQIRLEVALFLSLSIKCFALIKIFLRCAVFAVLRLHIYTFEHINFSTVSTYSALLMYYSLANKKVWFGLLGFMAYQPL